ncbi:MAG: hypothetical protein VKJ06_05780 [Vampirovibrionales bacterium]|nr:hypothetical protein [Vampirovibrionales bacterium]
MTLNQTIEHTWLPEQAALTARPDAGLEKLVCKAQTQALLGVCVRPAHASQTRRMLGNDSSLKLITVSGFPEKKMTRAEALTKTGNVPTAQKLAEVALALAAQAEEIDAVINAPQFTQEWQRQLGQADFEQTLTEWRALAEACTGKTLKLILETGLWTPEQVKALCQLASQLANDCPGTRIFVKTCTGYVLEDAGATPDIITLMREALGEAYTAQRVWIKASGGIKTPAQAHALIDAGAQRLGTSVGPALVASPTRQMQNIC